MLKKKKEINPDNGVVCVSEIISKMGFFTKEKEGWN